MINFQFLVYSISMHLDNSSLQYVSSVGHFLNSTLVFFFFFSAISFTFLLIPTDTVLFKALTRLFDYSSFWAPGFQTTCVSLHNVPWRVISLKCKLLSLPPIAERSPQCHLEVCHWIPTPPPTSHHQPYQSFSSHTELWRFRERARLIHFSVLFFKLLLLPRLFFTTFNNQQKPFIFQDNLISTHLTRQLKHHISCEIFSDFFR